MWNEVAMDYLENNERIRQLLDEDGIDATIFDTDAILKFMKDLEPNVFLNVLSVPETTLRGCVYSILDKYAVIA